MGIFKKTVVLAMALVTLASCASVKEIAYFQDSQDGSRITAAPVQTLKVGVSDKLFITVHSKNPELATIFNLPISTRQSGVMGMKSMSSQMASYTVDNEGNIDFPILGLIHIAGLTREEVARKIKDMIIESDLIKDAVVIVEFSSLNVSVLGEVTRPGRYELDKDRITILDAIAKAGDLTVTGLRRNVKVFREENGVQKCYVVDLTSGSEVFASPVYYLRQEDIVYVEPNSMRKRASTVNGNNVISASFWVSLSSVAISVATMIMTATRK